MTTRSVPVLLPMATGSPEVESLTGYVRRLAALLRVSNRALVHWLAPASDAHAYTEVINGTERLGGEIAAALVEATGVDEILRTSLAKVSGLHLRRDISAVRQWCPRCLDKLGYDLLVTTFKLVTVCPEHGIPLVVACAEGHPQLTWAAWSRPGRCCQCGRSLATAAAGSTEPDQLSIAAASVIGWIQGGHPVEPRRVAVWLRAYRGRTRLELCAQRLGLSARTVWNIERGAQRLRFSSVMSLMTQGGATIGQLHEGEPVPVVAITARSEVIVPRLDVGPLRAATRRELALPVGQRRSVRQLADHLQVNHVTLRRHVPELDQLIADRQQRAAAA